MQSAAENVIEGAILLLLYLVPIGALLVGATAIAERWYVKRRRRNRRRSR